MDKKWTWIIKSTWVIIQDWFFPMLCFYMVLDLHLIKSICQFLITKLKFEIFCIKLTLTKTCEDPCQKNAPNYFNVTIKYALNKFCYKRNYLKLTLNFYYQTKDFFVSHKNVSNVWKHDNSHWAYTHNP